MNKNYIPNTKEVIYQDPSILPYSIDTLLLDAFSKPKGMVADVGCGTGLLTIRAAQNPRVEKVHAFDIQERAIELTKLSIKENKLSHRVDFYLGDIGHIDFPKASLDTIITNPPFFVGSLEGKKQGVNQAKHLSHEGQWFQPLASWLKPRGDLYTILDTSRFLNFLQAMSQSGLEAKKLRFVHKRKDKPAMRVLVWAKKNARPQVQIEPPLIIYRDNNRYTEEVGEIYGE